MAITDKKKGVWGLDQVYNKQNQGSIWTNNRSGLLMLMGNWWGIPAPYNFSSPVQIPGTKWVTASGGGYSAIATKTDGTLWAWGAGIAGSLGQNELVSYASPPVQVGTDTTWHRAKMGTGYSAATKTDGTLWTWGKNEGGQLGINSSHSDNGQSSPTQIPGTTWNYIACDGYAMIATKTDNTLWAWGRNNDGELGHNNKTWYSSPVQIPGTTWSGPVGNFNKSFSCIRTDGTLWTWGKNPSGQLGLGDATNYSSPKQVPGTTWVSIGGGNSHVLATKTDGTLWAWGYNNYGQLGINDGTSYNSPKQVPGTSWSKIASTGHSSGAVKTDGTLWAWGYNQNSGQLGQNDIVNYSSPVQVPGTYSDIGGTWDGTSAVFFPSINE